MMDTTRGSVDSLARQLGIMAGAAGVTAAAFSSVNKAMDFEAQMSSIQALTGASDTAMQKMNDLAMEMGAQTKYSALEAAQGIEELLKAGLTPATVQAGGLEAALNLATAGGLDLAKASEIMSTALNSYKNDAMSAADASNILAGTANASATSVEELQYGLAAVSAVAAGVGMSFKDTNTALGVFANNGLKGSDAGTSLKTMIANLSPMTEKASEQMANLGLMTEKGTSAFYDARGNVKSMAEIADLLQNSLKDLNGEQRQQALYTMFGSDAIRAANILYKEGADGVKKFQDEMSKVTALDVAKEKMNNAAGAVEQFKGAMETLQIAAMTPLLPAIKDAATEMANFVGNLKPAEIEAFGNKVKNAFLGFYETAKSVATFIYTNWSTIKPVLMGVATAAIALKAAMLTLTVISTVSQMITVFRSVVTFARTAMLGLNLAMIANPMGLVVIGITALVAAGVTLYRNWDKVKAKASELWASMKASWDKTKKSTSETWDSVKSKISGAMNSAKTAVSKFFSPLLSFIEKAKGAWDGFKKAISNFKMPKISMPKMPSMPSWLSGGGGGREKADGRHYHGIDRIGSNGYKAILHKDEAVLNKSDAAAWRQMKYGDSGSSNSNIYLTVTYNGGAATEQEFEKFAAFLNKRLGQAMTGGA